MIDWHRCVVAAAAAFALVIGAPVRAAEPSAAEQLLAQYKRELQSTLRASMQEGVVAAIGACRTQAPGIAQSLSQDGFRVGRSSHLLRNPANAAPGWVEPILHDYVADEADREPRRVSLPDGRSGYVEPIMLQPLCTTCHGEAVSTEVLARIRALYPGDRAVGFRVGDLRGVFWLEYPALQ